MKVIDVNDSDVHSRLGHVVHSLRGRDAGKPGIVIGETNGKFVFIADGDKRKFDKPKKKNILHLEWTDQCLHEVVEDLKNNGRVTNAKLRYLLKSFQSENAGVQEKGE